MTKPPRKPKKPRNRLPIWMRYYDIHVEPLSGDVSVVLKDEVDDFTGQPINVKPQVVEQRKREAKVLEDFLQRNKMNRLRVEQEMITVNERRRKMAEDILKRKAEPKLAYNQTLTESGLVLTPIVQRKPWRRM